MKKTGHVHFLSALIRSLKGNKMIVYGQGSQGYVSSRFDSNVYGYVIANLSNVSLSDF